MTRIVGSRRGRLRSALLGFALASGAVTSSFAQPPNQPPALVETVPVVRDRVYEEVRLTGTVMPRRFTYVMSEVSGIVEELLVDDGSLVAEGQPLVVLRSAPTQFELDEARADLSQQEAELAELVNGERPEDIRSREAELQDAKARLMLAEDEEQRNKDLLQSGTTSQSVYDARRAELERARAAVASAEAALDRARNGARKEIIDSKRAEVESARARANRLEDQVARHVLRAPFSGVVGQKSTEVGQWLAAGSSTFALAEIDVLRVEVNLPERYFSRVALGSEGLVSIDAIPNWSTDATVTIRVPLGNQASRTFPIRLDVDNSERKIALGMFARVSFLVANGENEEALIVPKDALLVEAGGSSSSRLWVVQTGEQGSEAHPRTVRTVGTFRDMVIIAEGDLNENDSVVVRGNEGLMFPGQPVNPQPHRTREQRAEDRVNAANGESAIDLADSGPRAGRR